MFSKDDLIFSYTTKQAVADGVLIKADSSTNKDAAMRKLQNEQARITIGSREYYVKRRPLA